MFKRRIAPRLASYRKRRCIALVGPRQSGKTTLARGTFPAHEYRSLENPDLRRRALDDPRGFLESIRSDVILDEVQAVPELLSYLQEVLDDPNDRRQFVLTGSNSLRLNERIAQSLAGRVRILSVFPLVHQEIPTEIRPQEKHDAVFRGSYPRVYNENLDPSEWYGDYYNTYVQKDVRQLLEIQNLGQFDAFLRLLAGRTGNLANFSSLASEVGVSQPTAARWLRVLEASHLVIRLEPHFRNFNKRITKSPKLYFLDTGLACSLLRITNAAQLENHPLRGALYETWVVAEAIKGYSALGQDPPLYFWRDQHGHEVDLLVDCSTHLHPMEIKIGSTFQPSWLKNVRWLNELQEYHQGHLIYGGDEAFSYQGVQVVPWHAADFPFNL